MFQPYIMLAADQGSGIEGMGTVLQSFAEKLATLTPAIAMIALVVVGLTFVIGTKQMKEGAKENIYYIVAGIALAVGAVSIGAWLVNTLTF